MSVSIMSRLEHDARNRRARYLGELVAAIAGRLARFWARRGRE